MAFAFLPFPYLNTFSLTTQFLILLALVAFSNFYRPFRLILLTLFGTYAVCCIAVPVVRWGYAAFKAIAWFGFYVNFFIVGIGYIASGAGAAWAFPETLQNFISRLEGQ
ncbi:hypothetical protein GGX14DRAFT_595336 [Mycena pura]|uniref:Uncharacterized protein n=1 Tax=Mycena pura TaxID=153505 RepID=A0AAD6YFJ6_9AGAR|nr:hypothetical protein GGX14DRAFT_595336 [Mycena pura]